MSSLAYDIVLLPEDDVAQKTIRLSQQLKQYGTLFTLEGVCYPHLSLYMTKLVSIGIGKVKDILAAIAADTHRFDLTATRYGQGRGYIGVTYARTKELDNLQMTVVEAVNPLRTGLCKNEKADLATATGQARENIERYGYGAAGDLFAPHITLTRFQNGEPVNTATLPDPPQFSGAFTKIGLFKLGDNGTCIKQLATFELEGVK